MGGVDACSSIQLRETRCKTQSKSKGHVTITWLFAMTPKRTCTFKVVILGPPRVGKSALLKQMCWGKPISEAEMPSGVSVGREAGGGSKDMSEKEFDIGHDSVVVLKVWDAVGFDPISITSQFYKESVGIIFVYDSTAKEPLDGLQAIEERCKKEIDEFESVICFLVANKIDDENHDPASIKCGEQYMSVHKDMYSEFFQVSAKSGANVDKMFQRMAELLLERHIKGAMQPVRHRDSVVVLRSASSSSSSQRKASCAC